MKLFLARHGQTDWNIGKQSQGVADIELNATGIAQAEQLAEEIRRHGLQFDVVYSSPLRRAKKTAEIIVANSGPLNLSNSDSVANSSPAADPATHNTAHNIIYDDRLVERDYGELEGKVVDWDNLGADDLSIRQNTNIYGLEPIRTVLARSKSFLDDLKSRYATQPDARILIVAHGTLLKALYYNTVGYDEDTDLRGFHLGNCELAEYDI